MISSMRCPELTVSIFFVLFVWGSACPTPWAEDLLAEQPSQGLPERTPTAMSRAQHSADDLRSQADARVEQAFLVMATGNMEEASAHLRESLFLLDAAESDLEAAAVALFLATYAAAEERFDQAESDFRHALSALAVAREKNDLGTRQPARVYATLLDSMITKLGFPAPDPNDPDSYLLLAEGVATALLGQVLIDTKRFDDAVPVFEQLLTIAPRFGSAIEVRTLTILGWLERQRGELSAAGTKLEQALQALGGKSCGASRPDQLEQCFQLLQQLLDIALQSGHHEQALAQGHEMLRVAERIGDPVREVLTLKTQADIYDMTGQEERVRESIQRAESVTFGVSDLETRAKCLGLLGVHAALTGAYEKGVVYLAESSQLCEDLGLRQPAMVQRLLLALLYGMLGAHDRASREITKALSFAEQPDSSADGPLVSASLLKIINGVERGEIPAEELIAALAAVPDRSAFGSEAQLKLMEILLGVPASGGPIPLGKAAQKALEEAQGTETSSDEAMERVMIGMVNLLQGRLNEAERSLIAALETSRHLNEPESEIRALKGLSLVCELQKKWPEAVEYAKKVVDIIEKAASQIRAEEFVASFAGENTSIYEHLIGLLVATDRPAEAFAYAERARARALLRLLGNQRLNAARGGDPHLVAVAEAVKKRIGELERLNGEATNEGELVAARHEYEDLLLRLKLTNPQYADLRQIDSLAGEEVQALLPAASSLVSYFVLPTEVLAWVLDREQLRLVRLPIEREELEAEVRRFREEIAAQNGDRKVEGEPYRGVEPVVGGQVDSDLAERLYERLIAPLTEALRHDQLILIPHGPLHYLPFAALRNPETGLYLIQSYALTFAPSASVLRFLEGDGKLRGRRALILGDPELTPKHLPVLPGARKEAVAVAELLGTAPLLGSEATESRFRELGRKVDLLHVAAHGVYLEGHPHFSYLALASGGGHDGKLEMTEIFEELDLTGVDLVTLSACQTALGKRTRGDEIVGLIRAFLYAGAPAVLATLWSIDDEASFLLIEGFYRRLLAGEPAAAALRHAQLELIKRREYEAPYYWAAFTLTGGFFAEPPSRVGGTGTADVQHP